MKKILMATIAALMMAGTANAACKGGTEYTHPIDDHTYCVSNFGLNWWSAQSWCEANGRNLATIYEICPRWDGKDSWGLCNDVVHIDTNYYYWTSTAKGTKNAYYVADNGASKAAYVGHTSRNVNIDSKKSMKALCY